MSSSVRVIDVHCENNCLPGIDWHIKPDEEPEVETYLYGDEISEKALAAFRAGKIHCGHCKGQILIATEAVA